MSRSPKAVRMRHDSSGGASGRTTLVSHCNCGWVGLSRSPRLKTSCIRGRLGGPEADGIWTSGRRADVCFRLDSKSASAHFLSVSIGRVGASRDEALDVDMLIDRSKVDTQRLRGGPSPFTWRVALPAKTLSAGLFELALEIHPPRAWDEDERELGLQVRGFGLQRDDWRRRVDDVVSKAPPTPLLASSTEPRRRRQRCERTSSGRRRRRRASRLADLRISRPIQDRRRVTSVETASSASPWRPRSDGSACNRRAPSLAVRASTLPHRAHGDVGSLDHRADRPSLGRPVGAAPKASGRGVAHSGLRVLLALGLPHLAMGRGALARNGRRRCGAVRLGRVVGQGKCLRPSEPLVDGPPVPPRGRISRRILSRRCSWCSSRP